MEILKLYESILRFAGMSVDKDGYVSMNIAGCTDPALIKGERLVLPTREHLKTYKPGEKIIFHPLSENVLRGESEIISDLKSRINIRTNMIVGGLMNSLLYLVADTDLHKRLDPDQSELLMALGEVDQKAVQNFSAVVTAAGKKNMAAVFTNIYLKKGGTVAGQRYARAGITTFPFWNELMEDKKDIFGVTVRSTKDKPLYIALMKFIFPEIDVPEAYNYGSSSNTAPYLDALMKTSLKIVMRLADLCELYKPFIKGLGDEDLIFDSDWVEAFDNLDALRAEIRQIPMQAGNEGKAAVEAAAPAVAQAPVAPGQLAAPAALPQAAPVVQHAPGTPGALPWQHIQNRQAVPAQYPAGYPPAYPGVPAAGGVPPKPVAGKGGLDFQSLKAAVPGLAAIPSGLPQRGYPGMVAAPQAPRWAMAGVAVPVAPQYPGAFPGQVPQGYPYGAPQQYPYGAQGPRNV